MKKLIAVFALLVASAVGQTTPNLSLNIPTPGTTGPWPLELNNNFSALDSFLSGGTALPGNLIQNGYVDRLEIAAPSNPGSGYERWYANSSTHLITCLTSAGVSCLTPTAPGSSGNLIGNHSGVLGAMPGTTIDFTNGLLAIAPTGTGTPLSVTGDAAGSAPVCLFANSIYALPGHSCFEMNSDGSLYLNMYDQSTSQVTSIGPTGASIDGPTSLSGSVVINPGSVAGVALKTYGDTSTDDIQEWYTQTGGSLIAKMTHSGAFGLNFPVAAISTPALSSASTIAPTSGLTHLSGTATIATITPPYSGFLGCLNLIPTGLWTTTTSGGNIALATTAVINRVLTMCYDGTSWYPSY